MAFDFPDIQVGTTFGQTFSRQWQNMVEVVTKIDNLTVSHPLSLSTSQGSMRLEILDPPPPETIKPLDFRHFQIVNRDKNGNVLKESTIDFGALNGESFNYLTCQFHDDDLDTTYENEADIVRATSEVIRVWKPLGIRRSDYVNFVRVLSSQRRIRFARTGRNTRVATVIGSGQQPTEDQTIVPGYQPGMSIWAFKAKPRELFPPTVALVDRDIEWMAFDDRRWAAIGNPGG